MPKKKTQSEDTAPAKARYVVGVDLGTTNTVVQCAAIDAERPSTQIVKILQLSEFGETRELEMLPSFIFLPDERETPEGGLAMPWDSTLGHCVGELAAKTAPKSPNKVVASSKSWLCAENVDRTAPILPWNRGQPDRQISPLEAARLLLEHVKNGWNHAMAAEDESLRLENQAVVLTVPASFDAVARELTVKAAEAAGLSVTLIEEPQAAFYSWIVEMGEEWRNKVKPGDVILVCDIGGGTTDFSLIKVVDEQGDLGLERVAVGRHILLGGDNMDLALAHFAAAKFSSEKGTTLDAYQLSGLAHAARQAKEVLLSGSDAPPQKLTVLGRGSGVIAKTISVEIARDEYVSTVLDGFFPLCRMDDKPLEAKRSGLRTFGLNYEADPAVTRHLAAFVAKHCGAGGVAMPTHILFNGGVTKAASIIERIVQTVNSWLPQGGASVAVLAGTNPDQAVASGAAVYGLVGGGKVIRIKAGSSHSYYLGIESTMPAVPGYVPPVQALCVLPLGTEEGTGVGIPYTGLGLVVGETTQFRFFSSTSRTQDTPGDLVQDAERCSDLVELPSLTAALSAEEGIPPGSLVPVTLRVEFTETGTLQVWCVGDRSGREWRLEFELRARDDAG